MNALITRKHINSDIDVCEMGVSGTPDKIKFTIETDENEEFGFGVEFEVGFTDEECDEIDWSTIDVFTDNQTLERLKKFLKVFEFELERDFKEIDLKRVDSVLIVWDVMHNNGYFKDWTNDHQKVATIRHFINKMENKCVSELNIGEHGIISLQLLIDLDRAKTKIQ